MLFLHWYYYAQASSSRGPAGPWRVRVLDDPAEFDGMSAEDGAAVAELQWFMDHKISFNQLQSPQPQTLAHALADSAVGLTNTALYWFTNTGGSSIRCYYEDAQGIRHLEPTTVPLGVAGRAPGARRPSRRHPDFYRQYQ